LQYCTDWSINLANGARASFLAVKVFPQFIDQSVQYCKYVAEHLFWRDKERFELFFHLSKAAVIAAILKSNVKLHGKSAETPLICQNSIVRFGFDKKLDEHLFNTNLSVTSQEKNPSDLLNAYQRAFSELHTTCLAEYRRRYLPIELKHFSCNLRMHSIEDLKSMSQIIENEITKRLCDSNYSNSNPRFNTALVHDTARTLVDQYADGKIEEMDLRNYETDNNYDASNILLQSQTQTYETLPNMHLDMSYGNQQTPVTPRWSQEKDTFFVGCSNGDDDLIMSSTEQIRFSSDNNYMLNPFPGLDLPENMENGIEMSWSQT